MLLLAEKPPNTIRLLLDAGLVDYQPQLQTLEIFVCNSSKLLFLFVSSDTQARKKVLTEGRTKAYNHLCRAVLAFNNP